MCSSDLEGFATLARAIHPELFIDGFPEVPLPCAEARVTGAS